MIETESVREVVMISIESNIIQYLQIRHNL